MNISTIEVKNRKRRTDRALWDAIVIVALVAIILLGVSVMIGWHIRWRILVQPISGTIPIQYNTALAFLVLGASTLVFVTNRFHRLFPVIGSAFLVLLSGLTLMQYLTGRSFGIDTWLFTPWDLTVTVHPGRPALPTAIGFLASGIGLMTLGLRPRAILLFTIAQIITLGLSLFSISAYWIGLVNLSLFHLGVQMAIHTALGMALYSSVMLGYGWRSRSPEAEPLHRWGPATVTVAVLVFFVSFSILFQTSSAFVKALELLVGLLVIGLLGYGVYQLANFKLAYKGLILIAVPLLFILFFVALVIRMKTENKEAQNWYLHTKEVIATAKKVSTDAANAQYILRSYVATGNPAFATPYYPLARAMPESLNRLPALVSDRPLQAERAAQLVDMTYGRMTILAEVERLMREGQREQAAEQLKKSYDRDAWTQYLAQVEIFVAEEERLDGERQIRVEQSWQRLNWLLIAGALAAILLAIMLVLLFSRSIGKRLQTLSENAESLAKGEALSLPLTGIDEIAHLDQVFHKMAKSLEEARRKEGALIHHAQNVICSIEKAGKLVKVNPASLKTLGYQPEEIIGRQFVDLLAPDDAAKGIEIMESIQTTESASDFEVCFRHKGGALIPMLCSASWSQADELMFCIARDITERKRAEEALQNYADEIQDLYDHAPCGYHSLSADGTIMQMNQTELNWLGYAREEVIGKLPFSELLTPESRTLFYDNFPKFKQHGAVRDQEYQVRRKDGSLITVLLNATAIQDSEGNYLSSRSTLFDITERKQADDEIRKLNAALEQYAAQVTAANQELESFSYSVSHDLRAPLRHIDGFVALLAKNSAAALDEKGQRYLRVISEAAKRMGQLIDDLLAFSRMGRAEMQSTQINMQELVEEARQDLRKELEDRQVIWQIAPLPKVQADPAMLRLVLENLLSNAVKYTRTRREAVIEVGSQNHNPEATVFYVRDNGVGFDMKYSDKLFGVFQRLHRAEEFEGTGIGLANVRRIIHRHGGRAWAESKENEGATFYFSLPNLSAEQPIKRHGS
jgi:PAS domain S-box-containing protein